MNTYTVAVFGSFNANDRVNSRVMKWSLGKPSRVREQMGGIGVDIAAAGPVDESAWASAWWEIEISDTTVDGVSARVAALAAELDALSAITVGMPGSAFTGTLVPKNAECIERPITAISPVTFTETVRVVVEREAPVYTATAALYSAAALSLPAVLSCVAQNGDIAAPYTVSLDAAALELVQAFVAHVDDDNASIDDYIVTLFDKTWSAGDGDVDAAGYLGGTAQPVVLDPSPDGATMPATWTAAPNATYVHAAASKYHVEDDATPQNSSLIQTDFMDVLPSTGYRASAQVEVPVHSGTGIFYVWCKWYNSLDVHISDAVITFRTAATADTLFTLDVVSPATAAKAKFTAFWTGSTAAVEGVVYSWGLQILDTWQHTAAAYTDLDVTDYAGGEYLLLLNAKATTANVCTAGHPYADAVDITTTALHWHYLGVVSLPCSSVRGSAISTLRLTITGAGAGEYAAANAIAMLPLSQGGVLGWRKASGHAHTLTWEDGVLYADDVGDLGSAIAGLVVKGLRGRLVVLAEQATPAATTLVNATVSVTPRYEQLPSAPRDLDDLVTLGMATTGSPTTESGYEEYL